ncbi:MAG: glycosyltransferase [Desulfomonile sp.]|nr:glycosyltransferase [Desulfomonile sp.]
MDPIHPYPKRVTTDASDSSQTIRLFHVIDSLRRDGTQTALVNLVEGLAGRGYRQRVYCLNNVVNTDTEAALGASNTRVIVIGKPAIATGWGLARMWLDFARLRPTIVQTFLPFGDLIGRTIARAARVPVIVSSIRARNVDKPQWQLALDRVTARWVDRVVFNSLHTIDFALDKEGVRPEQVVYIPNGVKIGPVCASPARKELLSTLDVPTEVKVIVTVGRLYPQKGHAWLLNAFQRVLRNAPEAVLLIVGQGPLRDELEHRAGALGISRSVRFLGERRDVQAILPCADLYVQASLWEGMPNAVMEAMSCGKPVIATNVDGTRELLEHGTTGWLVEPGNHEALADRIMYALVHPEEAARLGNAAEELIRREFSVEVMVSRFDRLYRDLIGSRDR